MPERRRSALVKPSRVQHFPGKVSVPGQVCLYKAPGAQKIYPEVRGETRSRCRLPGQVCSGDCTKVEGPGERAARNALASRLGVARRIIKFQTEFGKLPKPWGTEAEVGLIAGNDSFKRAHNAWRQAPTDYGFEAYPAKLALRDWQVETGGQGAVDRQLCAGFEERYELLEFCPGVARRVDPEKVSAIGCCLDL